jgi:hypothetical protein
LNFPAGSVSYAATGVSRIAICGVARTDVTDTGLRRPLLMNPGDTTMIRKTTLFFATLFAAGTAFAFHCPQDMKKIDDAMAKSPKLAAAQMDEVKKYRAEGETLHKAGKHQESIDTLAKAMKILDVK